MGGGKSDSIHTCYRAGGSIVQMMVCIGNAFHSVCLTNKQN